VQDTRQDNGLCGIVNSLIEVDATGLFTQYNAAWQAFFQGAQTEQNAWLGERQAEFSAWFSGLRAMLDGNVEAQLSAAVASLQAKTNALVVYEITRVSDIRVTATGWVSQAGRWRYELTMAGLSLTGMDIDVIIPPAEMAPIYGTAVEMPTAGSAPILALYAAEKPEADITGVTVIIRSTR